MMSGPQRVLNKMNRWNYLSENSSTSSNQEYPDPFLLEGEKFDSLLDSKLISNAYKSRKPGQTKLQRILRSMNTVPPEIKIQDQQSEQMTNLESLPPEYLDSLNQTEVDNNLVKVKLKKGKKKKNQVQIDLGSNIENNRLPRLVSQTDT